MTEELAQQARALLTRHLPEVRIVAEQYLSGGYNNDNFLLTADDGAWVVRLPRLVPQRAAAERELAALRLASHEGIGAELVHHDPATGALVTRALPGSAVGDLPIEQWPEPAQPGHLLARLHATRGEFADNSDGPDQQIGRWLRQARALRLPLPPNAEQIVAACAPQWSCWCHCDLNPWNFLASPTGLYLIDWEWARIADPRFDLANLALLFGYENDAVSALLESWNAICAEPLGPIDAADLGPWLELVRLREYLWAALAVANGNNRAEIVEQRDQRWRELGQRGT